MTHAPDERYARQIRFAPIGEQGQADIQNSRLLVVGCGALGSVSCNLLVRAGVGLLRIVDRDFVELSNLQRQVLFDQEDVAANLPKAIAAANKLRKINDEVVIEPIVADVNSSNLGRLAEGIDLIIDGTDNFEIRFLINDLAVQRGIPWIYGGCLGAEGQVMSILPGVTPCLHCLIPDGPPPPGTTPTCDSSGILATIIHLIASVQVNEAFKILVGDLDAINRSVAFFSLWDNRFRQLDLSQLPNRENCPTCGQHEFRWLSGTRESRTAILCGRNAVQLSFPDHAGIAIPELAERLERVGRVEWNSFLLKFYHQQFVITCFPDGRAIISGTDQVSEARKLYSQFIGN
jgi:molybdopterin/thiamine biosynthesis adenylyltransferase